MLNALRQDAIIFVTNTNLELLGSITDGDIRRALIQGHKLETLVTEIIQPNPKYLISEKIDLKSIIDLRNNNYKIIPILDKKEKKIVNVLNFRIQRTILPIECVIMAGGKGTRLLPLTENIPKPLVKIQNKAIIEHQIVRLTHFGIQDCWISVNHLGDKIIEFISKREFENINISFLKESKPMGTIGSVGLINKFNKRIVLICNSDVLTNIDLESFYLDFMESDADMSVLSIPYKIEVPYAIMESENGFVSSLEEKPTLTYFSNGGFYLIKSDFLKFIPEDSFFNATDLIETLISNGNKVRTFVHHGYWNDIGKHEDLLRAQADLNNIEF
jgi:dTDP-glucose pyrophosphorylase